MSTVRHRFIRPSIRTAFLFALLVAVVCPSWAGRQAPQRREYNGPYAGAFLNRVAFPIGGLGAGMVCLEGTGALSHVSVRNKPQVYNEPHTYAALCVKGHPNVAKVLEGPVPAWKIFGAPGTGNGAAGSHFGFPRFREASFLPRFPFATVTLKDRTIPLDVEVTGWSPFVPGDADRSSLPVGGLEYRFHNPTARTIEAVFSFNSKNFMGTGAGNTILPIDGGFVLFQKSTDENPSNEGAFAAFVDDEDVVVDHCWFKGGWWDSATLAWRNIAEGTLVANPAQRGSCPGASLFVPFSLAPGREKTVRLMIAWYVPRTLLRVGADASGPAFASGPSHGTGPGQQEVSGFLGKGLVNTFDPGGDAAVGTLTSPQFELTHKYIHFLVGGGHADKTCIQLLIGDETVRSTAGENSETLKWAAWDIEQFRGKQARIRIVDQQRSPWGHILVDQILMTDQRRPKAGGDAVILHDFESSNYGDWAAEGPSVSCWGSCCTYTHHVPWYAGRFESINVLAQYWRKNYNHLRRQSAAFRDAFYDTTLPDAVVEAVAANLTILKSPTVLRQTDGRLWCFEGCCDTHGCCHGSCTHVWNYAQAICHLFPELERSLRQTEFNESQDERGHQTFRSALPIRPVAHTFHAAADGQLGGIMKVYRDWRICGDTAWLKALWPNVKQSLAYCITTWDPRGRGALEEPHHNTYDIEYWGPDGHCSSFYLGALTAAIEMGSALGEDVTQYRTLLRRGRDFMETKLYNGEYFYQKVQTEGLNAKFRPLDTSANGPGYNDIIAALNEQGPKYQYGKGCLSDGVLGFWIARVCGLDEDIVDPAKVRSNLRAIHKYNLKEDLIDHANPQRPAFAAGKDGGLLLCTWPHGGAPALPFVYSDEVWTGIEYQVASHLMLEGMVKEGLDIVAACRDRYDGRIRNPFNEYECGHWYARALSSYGLLQGLTGVRYDAVDKTLYIDSQIGDSFHCFLSTATGFGTVGLRSGRPFVGVKLGRIKIDRVLVSGKETSLRPL